MGAKRKILSQDHSPTDSNVGGSNLSKRQAKQDIDSFPELLTATGDKNDNAAEPPTPIQRWEIGRPSIVSSSDTFKISFWNLNGLRAVLKPHPAYGNKSPLLEYIEAEKPDILCLNETRLHETQVDEFSDLIPGYKGYFVCSDKKGYAGVATFVCEGVKVELEKDGLGNAAHDNEGRVQTLLVTPPNNIPTFYLVNTYVVNAGRGLSRLSYKIDSFNKDLFNYLETLRQKRGVVWTGDFNVAHQEIDIWNSKGNAKSAGHTPQERNSFGNFLETGHWIDTFRHFYPNKTQYTYWSAMQKTNLTLNKGWRLDYFVLSPDILPYCNDLLTRDFVRGSDHCPIVAIFQTHEKKPILPEATNCNGHIKDNVQMTDTADSILPSVEQEKNSTSSINEIINGQTSSENKTEIIHQCMDNSNCKEVLLADTDTISSTVQEPCLDKEKMISPLTTVKEDLLSDIAKEDTHIQLNPTEKEDLLCKDSENNTDTISVGLKLNTTNHINEVGNEIKSETEVK